MSNETQKMIQALLLYAIQELQASLQYDPDLHAHNLKRLYGVDIDSDAIASELEDIAESIARRETTN
jgi:hypothetical protein